MTPIQLEQRLAQADERIESLEQEVKATEAMVGLLIDSHPAPSALLGLIRATIQRMRGKTVPSSQRAAVDRALAKLDDLEAKVLARIKSLENEAARKRAAAQELQRRAAQEAQDREDEDDRSHGMSI
ncbi:hypothetical protein JY423_09250 [Stenotrophomonas maltophilia]|nr:hypothetical protein [Stenotrophomonas maltophilia]MBN4962436.1 hypothetical protein [Stenotrophomonas maltophilia]